MDEFTQRAREAFVLGFASTGGPATPRVQAGMVAAVDLACAHHLEPGVLETTLLLGQLEGTWARVYERREQIYADHIALITAAWRDVVMTAHLDIGGTVARYRRELGLVSEKDDDDDADRRRDEALALLLLLLAGVLRDRSDPHYQALAAAVAEAIRAGGAEGTAGAFAIAAQQLGYASIDFDQAYNDAYAGATSPHAVDDRVADAATVLAEIVRGTAADLARLWARLAGEGASHADMVDATNELLGRDEQRAVQVPVDLAMGRAITRAVLALYAAGGAHKVLFLTAGDGRVCPVCEQAEANNPYPIGSAPAPPLHAFCRCTLSPDSPLRGLDLARYLGGTT